MASGTKFLSGTILINYDIRDTREGISRVGDDVGAIFVQERDGAVGGLFHQIHGVA